MKAEIEDDTDIGSQRLNNENNVKNYYHYSMNLS